MKNFSIKESKVHAAERGSFGGVPLMPEINCSGEREKLLRFCY